MFHPLQSGIATGTIATVLLTVLHSFEIVWGQLAFFFIAAIAILAFLWKALGWQQSLIVAAVLITMCRLCASDFSWWDDQMTIHQNRLVTNPTFASLKTFWTTMTQGLYVPVTWTVWAAIAKTAYVAEPTYDGIFLNPWFFHTFNVLLHVGATLMVFAILQRLFKRPDAALIGALFFGVHPVQVESVGWISGMKDLLCWVFALCVVLVYIRRVQAVQASNKPLWASWELPACCVLLALGILSKPTAMVTPAALLALDGLLLRRQWKRTILELLPLFAITAGGAWVARVAQYVDTVKPSQLWQRPFIIGDNVAFYLGKILWPAHLGIDYSRTVDFVMSRPIVYVLWIIPAALAVLVLCNLKRRPVLAAGGAIFLIGFAPVSGIATFQMQHISLSTDHYLYFSLLGVAMVIAWVVSIFPNRTTFVVSGVVLLALAGKSFIQTGIWRDSTALFNGTIAANPDSAVARNNLAAGFINGMYPQYEKAEPLLEEAIRLKPDFGHAFMNLARTKAVISRRARAGGDIAFADKKEAEAVDLLDRTWKHRSESGVTEAGRSTIALSIAETMVELNHLDKALWWAEQSEELEPNRPATRVMLAYLKKEIARRAAETNEAAATQPDATTRPAPPGGSASGR